MWTKLKKLQNVDDYNKFLDSFETFLFDCDGVLWHGNTLLPRTRETLDLLKKRGKRIIFVTNNSSKSRKSYKKKLESHEIPAEEDEIFGSAYAAAVYLKQVVKFPSEQKVYVVGEEGIEAELDAEGIAHCGGTDPNDRQPMTAEDFETFDQDPSIGAVLCGIDFHFNYLKLCKAFTYLQNSKTLFLLTNDDSTYPSHGKKFPGAGSISSSLTFSTGRTPKSLGKPYSTMMDCIEAKLKFDKEKAVFIGDRLDTDILFAKNSNIKSLLVLTGVSTEREILADDAKILPDFYINQIGDLYQVDDKGNV
ncbi:4-nitrophenylphosphatase [Neolecta irregularis DAH-3]|uniref:4-nitrophenylphosphatase n=1 Tax=Neolecta irregularis (strain DAH-3) TaxID=1198029 RepID=A0A1U7LQQ2_NEOID|nr:4-nitrophenylphosphatase [Neolecta irregularis DAH-3]|eukprot:OLL24882.1 4-nitrophenylphosphatase [Neolecta irregularis DAH-3]